jgi:iron complex outermembrane receptor protein
VIAPVLLAFLAAAAPTSSGAPADSASAASRRDSVSALAHRDSVSTIARGDSVVMVLPEQRVESERTLDEARRRLPTGFVTQLKTRSSNRALETLPELIGQSAGAHIEQYGGLGAFSTVSLRGSTPGQVGVYLDGEPLTSASSAVVNLSDLPATAVQRVEIYRGSSPLSLGPALPGGAVNLVTDVVTPLSEGSVTHGSFGTWDGRASAGMSRGPVSGALHIGMQSSRGDFTYLDGNGTRYNSADDHMATRVNNLLDAATALGSLHWMVSPGTRLTLREDYFQKTQGLPGLGNIPALNSRLAFQRSLSQLELTKAANRAAPDVRVSTSVNRERSQLRDDGGPLGLGELRIGRHNSDDHFSGERGSLDLGWPALRGGFALTGSASVRRERANLVDPEDGYPDPPQSTRSSKGAAIGADWRPAHSWLTVHAARRWDRIVDHLNSNGYAGTLVATNVARELDAPQLGVRLTPQRNVEVRANWSRSERAPDFCELFGRQGSISGNALLRPESGVNRDVGVSWSGTIAHREVSFDWARFDSQARDLIVFWSNSPNTFKADNISSARIHGEELSLRARPLDALALEGSITWQSAIDDGPVAAWNGKRLPQRPGREAYARADLARGRYQASADLRYLGDDYRDRYNRDRVPSRTLVGASISALLHQGLRATVEGKNLGDRRVFDVGGYPLPGRSIFAALELRLGLAGSAP